MWVTASFEMTTDGSTVTVHDSATRFPDPSGPLLSQLTSATIIEAKTKTCQKMGAYLKLEVMMRANVHAFIHRLVV